MLSQNLTIKATQTLRLTKQMQASLQILQMKSEELIEYLEKCSIENPYLLLPTLPYRGEFDWDTVYEKTLQEHLLEQLVLARLSKKELEIVNYLTYNLDERGYLLEPRKNICAALHIDQQQLQTALNYCYQLEPIGCYATNLSHCFALQLNAMGKLDNEMQSILNDLNTIADLGVKRYIKNMQLPMEMVIDKLTIIKTLDPAPGSNFAHDKSLEQQPDIHILVNQQQKIEVTLNDYYSQYIECDNSLYQLAIQHTKKSEEQQFNKQKFNEATFLVKAVKQRATTMLKIAYALADVQEDFFYHGAAALHPLTLKDIAKKTNLHESTVSRISNKTIATPFGVYTIKYFFSSQLNSNITENIFSSTAIKKNIATLIENEGEGTLSDEDIVSKLSNQGVKISRRTVAKYRQELGINSSHTRNKLLRSVK